MQQLSGLDDLFLRMETEASFGHVASVSILEAGVAPRPITTSLVKEVFAQRLHLLPILRRRIVEVPFGFDHAYWVDDPDFDVDAHVSEVRLRKPGSQRQLQRVAAKIVAEQLDRSRPLWHTTVLTGIEGGRVGLLTRIHHACIDGLGGNDVLTTVMDVTPEPPDFGPAPVWEPGPLPDSLGMLGVAGASLAFRPCRYLELQRETAAAAVAAFARARASGGMVRRALTVPPTPFNHTISASRAWEFRRLPLEPFKLVKDAFGCSVNDVVIAVCAGALRRWLIEHDALPARPLVAGVPVSIREADDHEPGNRVSAVLAELPTNLADPLDRLRAAHESMASAKSLQRALPLSLLPDWAELATPTAAEVVIREAHALHIADWAAEPFNIVVSNVPGPQHTLYFAGAPLVGIYPLSALADGQGLNITLLGYHGALHFGLLACPELVPDLDDLADYLHADSQLLAATASRAPVREPRRRGGRNRSRQAASRPARLSA